jgi:hypothetical protein
MPKIVDDAVHLAVMNQFLKSGCRSLSDFKSRFVMSESGSFTPSVDYQEIRESLEGMNIPFEVLAQGRLDIFLRRMDDTTIDSLRGDVQLDRKLRRSAERIMEQAPDTVRQLMVKSKWSEAARAGISQLRPGQQMSVSLGKKVGITTGEIPLGLGDAKLKLAFDAAKNQSVSILHGEDGGYQVLLKGGYSAGAKANLDGLLDMVSIEAGVSGGINRGCILSFDSDGACQEFVAQLVSGQAGVESLRQSSGVSFVREGNIEGAVKISADFADKSVPPVSAIGLDNGLAVTAEVTFGASGEWSEERSATKLTRTHQSSYQAGLEIQLAAGKGSFNANVTKSSSLVYNNGALTTESSVSRISDLGKTPAPTSLAFLRKHGVKIPESHPYMQAIMQTAQAMGSGAKIEVSWNLTEEAMLAYNDAESDEERSQILSNTESFILGEVKVTGSKTESTFESGIDLKLFKYSNTVHSDVETTVTFDMREFAQVV